MLKMCRCGLALATGLLLIGAASGCHGGVRRGRSATGPDSTDAVRAAKAAVAAVPALGRGVYRVLTFRRDSAGALVGLQRADATLGGGGLVRVARDGSATIVELWQ
jgi:hypothetical protein